MQRAAFIMLCLALCAGRSAADDRALLIGIGTYRIEQANLPGVAEDLTMMREVARTLGFADSQVKVLADSEATLQGIRDAISDWLVDGTTTTDRVLFYHSGHGSRVPDLSGDESDGSDEALLPHDFKQVAVGEDEKLLSNVLLDDELGRLLARIPAREVVALVDSCHSGTMTRSLGGKWTSKFYRYPGIPRGERGTFADSTIRRRDATVLLSAARPEEEAQTSVRGALFTQGVWQAVRAAESGKQLTLDQLRSATERYIRQEVGDRKELAHRPMLTGHSELRSINLFLPTREAGTRLADAIPADPSNLWHQLEGLVHDAGQNLEVTTSQTGYRVGDSLKLSVVATSDGYLHIFNVGDGEDELIVLYPNRYQTNPRVSRGETVHIPSPGTSAGSEAFTLPARLPSDRVRQKNLVVAIQTSKPLLLGDREPNDPAELFRVIRQGELTRSIQRGSLATATYSAGQIVVTIGL